VRRLPLALLAVACLGLAGCDLSGTASYERKVVRNGDLARRGFIAGQLPNVPGVLVTFLENPPALVPDTGMPNVGLTPEEARHIAAYLYTLEPSHAR
jgi:hypothetical protein